MPENQPNFDLGIATSLCSAVYSSFFTPYHPDNWRGFERSLDETHATYTDKEFLKGLLPGILEVKVFCVIGLEPGHHRRHGQGGFWSVSLELGNNKATTRKISQTLRPDWNETLTLYVRDPKTEKLKIRIHQDVQGISTHFHRPQQLSFAELPIVNLCNGKAHDQNVSIKDTSSPDKPCKVYFQLQFKKIEDCLKDLVAEDVYLLLEAPCCPKGQAKWIRGPPEKLLDIVSDKLGEQAKAANRKKNVKPDSKEDVGAKTWKEVVGLTGLKVKGSFIPVAYLDNHYTDTQAWILRNLEARQVVVVFRSTKIAKEWLTNSKFHRIDWSPTWEGLPQPPYVGVHKAFLDVYLSMRPQLLALLDHATQPVVEIIQDKHCTCKKEEKWTVHVTGSSLGGALAMLCAYDIGVRERASSKLQGLSMYSFGAPRVGDKTFSERYFKYVPNSWRVARPEDFITKLPPTSWGGHFHHAPNCAVLKADGGHECSTEAGNAGTTDLVEVCKVMPVCGTDIAMLAHFIQLYPVVLYKSAQAVQDAKQAEDKKKAEQAALDKAAAYEPYRMLSPASWYM